VGKGEAAVAKGQYLSGYQQKIVKRFYEHADTRTVAALQEAVSDLYLAPDEKARAKLWTKVEGLLAKAGTNKARVEQVLQARDVKALAEVVGEITKKRLILLR
jgi:hypothetical protein